ncbi:hypothetical protein IMCC12053_2605 [Celeribacter marinus]|uniref:Uncharacterized protein n=1 Tax=Celeribacter marinus TaxID=1397108 RepID=A0A0P0ACJ1_9RHOB|nr:hypothetical protein IMCC12053_2605 [Celeribacter marinus]
MLACDVMATGHISDSRSIHANFFEDRLLLIIPPAPSALNTDNNFMTHIVLRIKRRP